MANDNSDTARAFLEALPRGKLTSDLLTEDFTAWTTSSGQMSSDKFRGGTEMLAAIFSNPMQIEIDAVTAEDDRVVVEAASYGLLVDGEEYRNRYVFVFRMRDGKVASFAEHNNPFVVQQKLVPLIHTAIAKRGDERQ